MLHQNEIEKPLVSEKRPKKAQPLLEVSRENSYSNLDSQVQSSIETRNNKEQSRRYMPQKSHDNYANFHAQRVPIIYTARKDSIFNQAPETYKVNKRGSLIYNGQGLETGHRPERFSTREIVDHEMMFQQREAYFIGQGNQSSYDYRQQVASFNQSRKKSFSQKGNYRQTFE